jgi:hypothetical protein
MTAFVSTTEQPTVTTNKTTDTSTIDDASLKHAVVSGSSPAKPKAFPTSSSAVVDSKCNSNIQNTPNATNCSSTSTRVDHDKNIPGTHQAATSPNRQLSTFTSGVITQISPRLKNARILYLNTNKLNTTKSLSSPARTEHETSFLITHQHLTSPNGTHTSTIGTNLPKDAEIKINNEDNTNKILSLPKSSIKTAYPTTTLDTTANDDKSIDTTPTTTTTDIYPQSVLEPTIEEPPKVHGVPTNCTVFQFQSQQHQNQMNVSNTMEYDMNISISENLSTNKEREYWGDTNINDLDPPVNTICAIQQNSIYQTNLNNQETEENWLTRIPSKHIKK